MSPTELVILKTVGDIFKVKDAAKASGQSSSSASTTVRRMEAKGLVVKVGHGTYQKIRG